MLQCFSLSFSLSLSLSLLGLSAFIGEISWKVRWDLNSNTATCNIWHIFSSQGQLKLFIERMLLNFPRFPLNSSQSALSIILNISWVVYALLVGTFHQRYQKLSRGVRDILSSLIANIFFFTLPFSSTQPCPNAAHNTNLITCKLEISPDPSKWYFLHS